jgi:DNA polymerase III delta prime subunit
MSIELFQKDVNEYIWSQKYRPKNINDLIITPSMEDVIKKYIYDKDIPDLILYSDIPGTGKTSTALVLANELQLEYLLINASANANIDTLRNDIQLFAQTVSMNGKKKIVILDEADNPTSNAFYPALRPIMEQFSHNCSFILTCNSVDKIPDPIKSRCQTYEFIINDKKELAKKIFSRLCFILDNEHIEYNKKVISDIVLKYFPDIRSMIQSCQQHQLSLTDVTIKNKLDGYDLDALFLAMKDKDFTTVREVVYNNIHNLNSIYIQIYDKLKENIRSEDIATSILIINEYQYKHYFVVNKEINIVAFLIELTKSVQFIK